MFVREWLSLFSLLCYLIVFILLNCSWFSLFFCLVVLLSLHGLKSLWIPFKSSKCLHVEPVTQEDLKQSLVIEVNQAFVNIEQVHEALFSLHGVLHLLWISLDLVKELS